MYGLIRLPYTNISKPERDQETEGFSFGALATSAMNLDFTGKDGVFSQISKGVGALDVLNSKISVVAMTQLAKDGKITSEDALNYLCTGFANQMRLTAIAMGYQSIQAMKSALRSGNINAGQFLTSLSGAIGAFSDQDQARNINKEESILFDLVLSETFSKISETAERRVENGDTLSEFIHNMPIVCELTCQFIEGVNYSKEEFNWYLDYLRDKKVVIAVQLGDDIYSGYVLTNYSPTRAEAVNGFEYQLSFKEFKMGSVSVQKINIQELNNLYLQKNANIVTNKTNSNAEDKTTKKREKGTIETIIEGA